jgi:hypothetical protein
MSIKRRAIGLLGVGLLALTCAKASCRRHRQTRTVDSKRIAT